VKSRLEIFCDFPSMLVRGLFGGEQRSMPFAVNVAVIDFPLLGSSRNRTTISRRRLFAIVSASVA